MGQRGPGGVGPVGGGASEGGGRMERRGIVADHERRSGDDRRRTEVGERAPESAVGQLGVVPELGKARHGAGRAELGLAGRHHLGRGQPGGPGRDELVELVGPVEADRGVGQVVVGQKLDPVHGDAQPLPLMEGGGGDADPAVGRGVEADGVVHLTEPVPGPSLDHPLVGVEGDRPLVAAGEGLHGPDVDERAPALVDGSHGRGLGRHRGEGADEV